LVTTTSHAPGVEFDGGEKVQVIRVEVGTLTLVAVIFGLPLLIRVTVAPIWKFVPIRSVMEITVPAVPSSGIMFRMEGFASDAMVVVAVTVVVVETVAVVAGIVGVRTGIDAGALLIIFCEYTFSIIVLLNFSVSEFRR
jgi:hypothetical protein